MENKIIKIAVTGPESTGKSEITRSLAAHYNEPYAEEYARQYLEKTDGRYSLYDLEEICKGQIEFEEAAIQEAERMCFLDTEMLVLRIWSEFRFGKVPEKIKRSFASRQYDFYLLCNNDLPWKKDGLRESPDIEERNLLFSLYQKHLSGINANYNIVGGTGKERQENALKAVQRYLKDIK